MGPMGRRAGLIFIRRSFRDDPGLQARAARVRRLAGRAPPEPRVVHRGRPHPHRQAARPAARACSPTSSTRCTTTAATTSCCNRCRSSTTSCSTSRSTRARRRARPRHPESLGRLVSYARAQRTRYSRGDIHVSFGEPISVREHLTRELEADAADVAATPMRSRCRSSRSRWRSASTPSRRSRRRRSSRWRCSGPTARSPSTNCWHCSSATRTYVDERGFPVTCRPIATRDTLLRGLASLQRHGVVTRNDHGQRGRVPHPAGAADRRLRTTATASSTSSCCPRSSTSPRADDAAAARRRAPRCATCSSSSSSSRRRASSSPRSTPRRRRTDRPVTAPVPPPVPRGVLGDRRGARARTATSRSTPRRSTTEACGLAEQYLLQAPHLLRRRGLDLLRRRRGAAGRPPRPPRARVLRRPRRATRRVRR